MRLRCSAWSGRSAGVRRRRSYAFLNASPSASKASRLASSSAFVMRVAMHYAVLACQSAGASFRPAARSDISERGWATSHRTIRVRQAHKSLHRRSHKGGRGGGLMSARRASRRLTGGAPGIPGNNNQPPRRQQRVSVAARLNFRSRRLPDPAAGPSASSCSAHTAVQDVLGAKHEAHRIVPAGRNTARAERGSAAARQVLRPASRVTAAVAVNRGASHFQLGNLYAGQTA
jgi:hypothetical protein